MKILLRKSPFLLALVLVCGSCQLEKLQDPIVITKQIEKEFYIDLQEYLHPTNRQLRFQVRTIKDQECLNGTVETDYYTLGRSIELSINSIQPPADCKSGMAPARSEVLAGQLPNGVYDFDVALRNTVVNKGQLTVNDEHFSIKMETQEGIIFLHNVLQKMPNDAFWGYVVCREDDWQSLNNELTDRLNSLAVPASYRPGFYGYFEINNNTPGDRKVFLTNPPAAEFHFPLLYQLADGIDESRLRAVLDAFRLAHPEIKLEGRNTDGRLF